MLSYGQAVTNGLIGYWPFNGNANDESKNSNNGKVVGATLTADRFGQKDSAYYFDGSGDYINVGRHSSLLKSSLTVNLWFKYTDTTKFQYFINCANSLLGEWGVSCAIEKNAGVFGGLGSGSNDNWVNTNSKMHFADGDWHMYTMTYNSVYNHIVLYIDGCYVTAANSQRRGFTIGRDSIKYSSTNDWIMGAHSQFFSSTNNAGPRYYKGYLDDVAMYNRELSVTEVEKLYGRKVCGLDSMVYDTVTIKTYDTLWTYDTSIVMDTVQHIDTIWVNDTLIYTDTIQYVDTIWIMDTIQVMDTLMVYDTITVYDTVSLAVTDTLYINIDNSAIPSVPDCGIKVYPNPSNSIVNIASELNCSKQIHFVRIENMQGQLIYQSTVNGGIKTVDISMFGATGTYTLSVLDKNQQVLKRTKLVLY
jgi:hypothetical protein